MRYSCHQSGQKPAQYHAVKTAYDLIRSITLACVCFYKILPFPLSVKSMPWMVTSHLHVKAREQENANATVTMEPTIEVQFFLELEYK